MIENKRKKLFWLSQGFTFIELLIVTMILAIIAAIGLVRAGENMNGFNDRILIDQLIDDINYAQTSALARRETITIAFDAAEDAYTVYLGAIDPGNKFKGFPNGVGGVIDMNSLQLGGVDLTSANFNNSTTLQFLPNGTPVSGGSIEVNDKTLSIQSETGKCIIN
ncbi:MAG: GspH/FimT family pseudopilin [Candidatus Neomarinimicrobiota bacterium]